jgi:serine/threonine protein kinase
LPPRTVLKERYVLGRVLGHGGFGITYLAFDLIASQKLAIKEYFPAEIATRDEGGMVTPLSVRIRSDFEYGVVKFVEEAEALARFKDHPAIVSMLDFFRANGTAYIVTAYIEGGTLREHLFQKAGKISFTEALGILGPVMGALEDLHKVGMLHRDISPDNIFLEEDGGVRILDFGAARYAMGEQSRSLSLVLKPGYAPEEQYRSRGKQGPWTDIYALGATFYRSIAGRVPPEAPDRMHLDDLVPPSQLGVDIPPRSEAALLKALAVKAENRYNTVAEFRHNITAPISPSTTTHVHLSKSVFLSAVSALLLVTFLSTILNLPVIVPVLSLLGLFAIMLILFFTMWRTIQDGHGRTTPQKAVAFCFIPVFNFYWAFPVLWGFAQDYNRFLDRRSLDVKKLNETLFLCCSLTFVLSWSVVPFGRLPSQLLMLLNASVMLPVVANICDAVNALRNPQLRKPPPLKKLSLYCVAGEYQGQALELGDQPIVIGRNPARSNLVLSPGEVSANHVRMWLDSGGSGVWVEDLNSTGGTFYRPAPRGDSTVWLRLSKRTLLSVGDRFRLSEGVAEFEVMGG